MTAQINKNKSRRHTGVQYALGWLFLWSHRYRACLRRHRRRSMSMDLVSSLPRSPYDHARWFALHAVSLLFFFFLLFIIRGVVVVFTLFHRHTIYRFDSGSIRNSNKVIKMYIYASFSRSNRNLPIIATAATLQ